MSTVLKDTLDSASSLSNQERLDLAHILVMDIDQDELARIEAERRAVIRQRIAEIESGAEKGVSVEEVFALLQQRNP